MRLKVFRCETHMVVWNDIIYELPAVIIIMKRHNRIALRKFFFGNSKEFIELVSMHAYIQIVIPRNESFVPYCAKICTPVGKISDVMF